MDSSQRARADRQRHPSFQETVRESWYHEGTPQAGALRETERATEEEGHRSPQACHPTHGGEDGRMISVAGDPKDSWLNARSGQQPGIHRRAADGAERKSQVSRLGNRPDRGLRRPGRPGLRRRCRVSAVRVADRQRRLGVEQLANADRRELGNDAAGRCEHQRRGGSADLYQSESPDKAISAATPSEASQRRPHDELHKPANLRAEGEIRTRSRSAVLDAA
jgi:hypothetical protein